MTKKLLIWDFDGVIANTEDIWLHNRQYLLKTLLGIDWHWQKINQHLRGISDLTKKQRLLDLGINTDYVFWDQALKLDEQAMRNEKFALAPGIKKIFKLPLKQCIATGGTRQKTALKIKNTGIEQYFPPSHVFTADMVKYGKPSPDLFLLACQKMNESAQNTVVIEDSIAGLTGALNAGCTPIAYLGFYKKDQKEYLENLKKLNLPYFCNTMSEVYKIIEQLF